MESTNSRKIGIVTLVLFAGLLVIALLLAGRSEIQAAPADDTKSLPTVDESARLEIIDSAAAYMDEIYVFPDVAQKMAEHVRQKMADGDYDEITDLDEFCRTLTNDLREISHDRHLGLAAMTPEQYGQYVWKDTMTEAERQRQYERLAYNNFAFYKVERLKGNVGYLEFRQFHGAELAGETAIAAMKFLAHCDALIIDLRQNGGGSPSMIQLITSYFFEEPVHLNSFYIRKTDSVKQFWTSAYVDGERMTDVDIYVLTSDYTFSGAEEFTYNLKNLERATIIGETTGGGAHPIESRFFANLSVGMRVPFGRAINPISGTNWEGTGIEPDIKVPAERALDRAYLEALKGLREKESDEDRRFALDWAIADLEWKLNPVEVDESVLKSYVGVYGPREITWEDGALYYQREERPKYRMLPMAEDLFRFDEIDYFRLKVITDDKGRPVELQGRYDNGHVDHSPKSEGT